MLPCNVFTVFLVTALISCRLLLASETVIELEGNEIPTLSLNEDTKFGLISRIVNGTAAALGQFPHQVSLRRSWSGNHFCGGSVITEKWIITAAHCMYLNDAQIQPWTIMVVGGEIWLNVTSSTGQRSRVSAINVHPDFDIETLESDIAILKLETPFVFNSPFLQSASLQTSSETVEIICQVSGWGYPSFGVPIISNELMYVDLPILTRTLCRTLLANKSMVPYGMFCAGYFEGGKDACQGDSGGGMMCNNFLTGIVSGGFECASPNLPGLYTDVQYYIPWILGYVTDLKIEITTRVPINSTEYDTFNVTGKSSGTGACSVESTTRVTLLCSFLFMYLLDLK